MIILNQKRVRKIPLSLQKSGASQVRLIVPADRNAKTVKDYALNQLKLPGDRMIPAGLGTATRKSLEGRIIVHRDQPKELYSWDVLWGRHQYVRWQETEWVEDYVTHLGKRYPRTQLPPENVEVLLLRDSEGKEFFASDPIAIGDKERVTIAINVFLEIFGFCGLGDPLDLKFELSIQRRVNWRLLPKGTGTRRELEKLVNEMPNKIHRNRAHRSLDQIQKYGQSEVIVGEGGFHGYVAFPFPKAGFTLLESIYPNNATYVLGPNWEETSKLSKREILESDLHLRRIVHDKAWEEVLDQWFSDQAA